MPVKYIVRIICLTLTLTSSAVNASEPETVNFELLKQNSLNSSNSVKIDKIQAQLVFDFLTQKYDDWWEYDITSAYTVPYVKGVFVKVVMNLREEKFKAFKERQSDRVMKGLSREATGYDDKMVIINADRIYELPIQGDLKNQGLKFQFSYCTGEETLKSLDLNQDGKHELLVLKGYEGGFNNYYAVYNHYKLYYFDQEILLDTWLTNIDYSALAVGEAKNPNITGLNNGVESIFSVYYDEGTLLVKKDRLGLMRENSLFFLNHIDQQNPANNKQLIFVWSKIYRPSPDLVNRDFIETEEYFQLYEGRIATKKPFVEKAITKEQVASFIKEYNLIFEDGLTKKNYCNL